MIEGRLVGGRYLLLDTLERRGFGPSHRAEDRITGRTVVVTGCPVSTACRSAGSWSPPSTSVLDWPRTAAAGMPVTGSKAGLT